MLKRFVNLCNIGVIASFQGLSFSLKPCVVRSQYCQFKRSRLTTLSYEINALEATCAEETYVVIAALLTQTVRYGV